MKTDLPNLLTASSILLGIITALYGLFFPAINSILEIKPKLHKVDNKKVYNESKDVIKAKYVPLLIGSLIITLVNIPELIIQLRDSYIALKTNGIENARYDTLTASFIVVCLFMIFISIMIIVTGVKLKKKLKELNPNEK
jgi:predicted PurR-regulated permease PerM